MHRLAFDLPNLDIHAQLAAQVSTGLGGIYESLIAQDEENPQVLIPSLAESWKFSQDGKILTFVLRKNVKFHDGSSFDGADAKASLDHALDPKVASPRAGSLTRPFIEKTELVDPYTLVVHLKSPNVAVLQALASRWVAILPVELIEDQAKREQNAIGTGPFILKSYQKNVSMEWVKNTQYWNPQLPYLDGVKFAVIRDESAAQAALASGTLMSGGGGDPENAKVLRAAARGRLVQKIVPGQYPPSILLNPDRPPFDNPKVRKAIFLAVNRQDVGARSRGNIYELGYLHAGIYGEYAIPLEELLKTPGYRQPKDQDILEAKALLKEAGFPTGFNLKVLVRNAAGLPEDSQVVVPQLEKIGVVGELEIVEATAGLARVQSHDYAMAIQGLSQLTTDPGLSMQGAFFTNAFAAWKSPPEIQSLLDQQFAATDPVKRRELLHQIQRYFLQGETGIIHLVWGSTIGLHWDYVKGPIDAGFQGNPYSRVWLDR
ncbi:MAG: hypothetical protein HY680_00065 [Chloroflexi bacterium]|nr:hypothetical protein [Chloroflexota bacterium]